MEVQLKMNIPQMNNYGHAYLDELENDAHPFSYTCKPTDSRMEKWTNQRAIYGFDDSETWDLNSTFYAWLYERLRMYIDVGGEVVDLGFHKFNWKGNEYTQREIVEMILDHIHFYFSEEYNDFDEDDVAYINEIGELWALVLPAMWW